MKDETEMIRKMNEIHREINKIDYIEKEKEYCSDCGSLIRGNHNCEAPHNFDGSCEVCLKGEK